MPIRDFDAKNWEQEIKLNTSITNNKHLQHIKVEALEIHWSCQSLRDERVRESLIMDTMNLEFPE